MASSSAFALLVTSFSILLRRIPTFRITRRSGPGHAPSFGSRASDSPVLRPLVRAIFASMENPIHHGQHQSHIALWICQQLHMLSAVRLLRGDPALPGSPRNTTARFSSQGVAPRDLANTWDRPALCVVGEQNPVNRAGPFFQPCSGREIAYCHPCAVAVVAVSG